MTDQNYLEALLAERRGYEMYGKPDRVKLVDAEIARVKRRTCRSPLRVSRVSRRG